MKNYLYVEDNDLVRNTWTCIFEDTFPEHKIVAVVDYQEAVKAIDTLGPFDAIVSDFNYPGRKDGHTVNQNGMGGADLLEYVRNQNLNVPFVFISGNAPQTVARDLASRNLALPDAIFQKPALPEVIVTQIERLLSKAPETPKPLEATGHQNNPSLG